MYDMYEKVKAVFPCLKNSHNITEMEHQTIFSLNVKSVMLVKCLIPGPGFGHWDIMFHTYEMDMSDARFIQFE